MARTPALASALQGTAFGALFDLFFQQIVTSANLNPLIQIYTLEDPRYYELLAKQFGVAGYGGFALTDSVDVDPAARFAQQKALLQRAILLQRKKGTPFSIRESLRAVGFYDVQLIEGGETVSDFLHNGAFFRDGARQRGDSSWAQFSVILDLGNSKALNALLIANVRRMINEYKPARCELLDVSFRITLTDSFAPSEEMGFIGKPAFVDLLGVGAFHDGSILRDGTRQRQRGADTFRVKARAAPLSDAAGMSDSGFTLQIINRP